MTNLALSPSSKAEARRVPVTLDDLRAMERALFQNPDSRFSTTQRVFFEALLSHPTMDIVEAARLTQVSPAKATSWVAQPAVQAALNHLLTSRMKRLGLDKDAVLQKIVDLLEMAMGEQDVIKAGYDKDTGTFFSQRIKETDLGAAARFTDQLSKHFQLYAPDGVGGLVVNVQLDTGAQAVASISLDTGQSNDAVAIEGDYIDTTDDMPLEDEDFLQ